MRTEYSHKYNRWLRVKSNWRLALSYMKSRFLIDVIVVLPFSAMSSSGSAGAVRIVRLLPFGTLLRMVRSARFIDDIVRSTAFPFQNLDLAKFVMWTLILSHWIACLFSAFYGFTLVLFWQNHLHLVAEVKDVFASVRVRIPGSWEDTTHLADFSEKGDRLASIYHISRTGLAIYPFAIVGRFLKALSAQPRLAMVTKTLGNACVDIYHFGIVFGTVFAVYTVSAITLFGQELDDFANIGHSMNTVFRVLLGDFTWDEMNDVGRLQTGIWVWSFTWLVLLIMLNMLLAIVMDVYTEGKGSIGTAETLITQTNEIIGRVWERRSTASRKA